MAEPHAQPHAQPQAELHAEVVVVGSGMGGATTAWALAQRGVDVLVLERGERLPREPQNWSPEAVFLERRYKPTETWLDRDGRAFVPGVHHVVGGNTKVYGASLPRFRESDFGEVEHLGGRSPAWPFSYDDLEPYYGQAEQLYRVHGLADGDPTAPRRSTDFPFPAVPHEPYVADLADRLREAGVHPSSTAMGIDLREGGACVRCATCDGFPCRVDAKSDAETCALDPALATGHVRLATGTLVRRVVTDAAGGRVTHLLADGPEGPVTVRGERFVLSGGAVASAALLLASADGPHPHGLANSSDQVGRRFMMHNNAHIAAVDLDRRNDVVFQKTLGVNDWYDDGGAGHPLGSLQLLGKVQGSMMKSHATRVPRRVLDAVAARSVEWLVMGEDLPDADNRITLEADGTLRCTRRARNTEQHALLHRRAKKLMRRAGYDVVATQHFDISMNSHMCGTVVAGHDPATSVLDPWCRSHDLANLWVVDGGFFPSSAAMNPALTIAAQALRVVAESTLAG
ncbi:Choline dehydrogenase [Nocardioides scoriae]|uniref:Choline dehydrogenase n=1 Tax=Nocardioides scoriae TaxID=642780 RepID=A0A1H1W186_9ACTN|nr:GMC family oxidoreductase [Nocardioides scoriae]SDS90854.1 Choline dehydrogenase [Nocardioides scoriae]